MSKRLIDAEILAFDIKVKRDWLDTSSVVGRGEYIALNKALVMIDEQPTVDAVEVVRCKDCKKYIKDFSLDLCSLLHLTKGDDFYCADGERREEP